MQQGQVQQILEVVTRGLLTCTSQLSPQQLASVASVLAGMRCHHRPLLEQLAEASAAQAGACTPPQAAQLLWSLGRCVQGGHKLHSCTFTGPG